MTDAYDAILVGGGHNGLVCAGYLAKAGRRVLVLEAGSAPGGAAVTREFAPGYSVSACAHWAGQLSAAIVRDLQLERHGLRWAAESIPTVLLDGAGDHLTLLGADVSGARLTDDDQAAWRDFHTRTQKYAALLARVFEAAPPRLVESTLGDRLALLRLALGLKLLGREDMRHLMRIALTNMYDLMEEQFASAQLKALLSFDSVLGARMGPRTPGTVYGYLHRRVLELLGRTGVALPAGGMGALGAALADAARARGADIRFNSRVESIDLFNGRVAGVTLASGEQLRSAIVVSNADPVTTFEKLVGFRHLETGLVRRVHQIRSAGTTAKLHLALDGLPRFTGLSEGQLGQRLVIAPDMDYIERAFNAVKYGQASAAPALEISIPSIHDPTAAPPGCHVLSAVVQFAPTAPAGDPAALRAAFTGRVLDTIAAYAPGIREQVVASQLLLPEDLERAFGMRGGHWHHVELSLDQLLMMRPFPGASRYTGGIDGLYLCGAGTHPGGGVSGLPGRNAAREILAGEAGA